MERLPNYGDQRQSSFCVHCGGTTETRDHAPSKVFLDLPYPDYMPSLPCCEPCNRSFSEDEEYLAAFIDCVVSGTSDPERVKRTKVQKILARNNKLRQRIELRKNESDTSDGDKLIVWEPEEASVRNVIIKLARCHAAYELNEPQLDEPDHVLVMPLISMTQEQHDQFEGTKEEAAIVLAGWPEVGSRAMQRLVLAGDAPYSAGWITVQKGRYRFMALATGAATVRGVLSEYLAYEVIWD